MENMDALETVNTVEPMDWTPVKKAHSSIGWALCVILAAALAVQLVLKLVLDAFWPDGCWLTDSSTGMWLFTFAPLYLVAIPAGLLVMKHVPASPPSPGKMSAKDFWIFVPICFFLTYSGNIVGNVLSLLISGGEAHNALNDYALDSNPLKILFVAVLAPLLEEYVFRKQLIDRTRIYGEKNAVFLSALTFALFHTNLFQFFYAFLVGWVLGYVYLRTGRLRYAVIMHSIVNFVGSVIAPLVLSAVDLETLSNLDPNATDAEILAIFSSVLPGLLLYYLFALALLAVSIIGLVLLIRQCKRLKWETSEKQLPAGSGLKGIYLNAGMVVFLIVTLGITVVTLFV